MQAVKWGEFKVEDVLDWMPQKEIDPLKLKFLTIEGTEKYPFYGQSTTNNGVISYETLTEDVLNNKDGLPTILVHSNNQNVVYVETPFYLKDGHGATSVLQSAKLNKANAMFLMSAISKVIVQKFSYQEKATKIALKNTFIQLPITSNNEIDFDFMESFIRELEEERIRELSAYLTVSGLADATLTANEEASLLQFKDLEWQEFNVESLFGKSTRGKRLKSDDRIEGCLPFVTAGEANEGISAFISNKVEVFSKNTTTIDMFGSAKYRNYDYGADDHVAVVHTENLNKYAAIFVTTACHKSAHNGQFNYGHNFYAKDADSLYIFLPTKNGKPDYEAMETFISAVQKLVIKDVVKYADDRIAAAKDTVYKIPKAYGETKVAEAEPLYGK